MSSPSFLRRLQVRPIPRVAPGRAQARVLALATAAVAVAVLAAGVLAAPAPARADLPPLIPRDVLFGNPERLDPTLSPDGKRIAWLAPDDKNVLQVWVKALGGDDKKDEAKKVTADKKRGIRRYLWAEDDRTLLYLQDTDGDENFHVYGVDLASGNVRDYTPFQGVRAEPAATSRKVRGKLLVTMNLRERRVMDVYEIDLQSGASRVVAENPGDVVGWVATDDLAVRGATASMPDGGTEVRVRDRAGSPWRVLVKAPFGELVEALDFSADGKSLLLRSTLGSDTTRVLRKEVAGGKETVLASRPGVDADDVVIHPTRHVVEAVNFPGGRKDWMVLDPAVKADFAAVAKLSGGDLTVESRDRADRTWLVSFNEDRGPLRYYSWDRAARKGTFLFVHRPGSTGSSSPR